MRSSVRRVALGGLFLFTVAMASAADVADDALKAVLESDVKRVNELVEKYNATPDKKSPIQIRSSSMMIAAYAQSKMEKDKEKAKAWAGLRDQALEVYKAAGKGGNLKGAKPIDLAKMGEGKTEPVALAKETKLDIDSLMAQFKKTEANGLNMEKDIKDASNKKGTKVDVAAIVARVGFVGDFLKEVGPDGGFEGGKKNKKEWDSSNEKMIAAAKELTAAAGKADKEMAALKKLDGACTACHNVFK